MAQSYTNWEAIIVDDGSTDDSVAVIKEIIGEDERFTFIQRSENKGCGYTKRECAKHAKGEISGFLDPDDTILEDALQIMVDEHKDHPDVAIITSRYALVDMKLNFIENGSHGSAIPNDKSYLTFGKGALTAFASFKQQLYDKTEGIDPNMKRAVDQDLYYKMEEQGEHLFLDKVLYNYRIHENSISNNENLYKAEYWHFYAIMNAYKRRKRLGLKLDNFSQNYASEYASRYYLTRFRELKHSKKTTSKFYFIWKAIHASPFHQFKHKIKSLLLLILGRI